MIFASATTTEHQTHAAVDALITQVRAQLPGQAPDLCVLFFSPHFGPQAAQVGRALRNRLNAGVMVGCSAEGVIGDSAEIERTPAVTLVAAHLPDVQITPFVFQPADWRTLLGNPLFLSRALDSPDDPRLFVMLADPFSTPIDQVLDAFNSLYPALPMAGGMVSSAEPAGGSWLLLNERVYMTGAVGLVLSGKLQVDVIVSQGCRPVGDTLTVTAAEQNVIYGIEGQPPLIHIHDLVTRLSEADRALLRTHGLLIGRAIRSPEHGLGRGDFLIRGVVGLDQQSGAIAIGDVVHEGETVQFHLRDAETAREDLEMMLLAQTFFEPPRGALLFSCNGRGTHLYGHPNGDISTITDALGQLHLAGCFCAGEIGPVGARNFLHGHTASLALFRPLESVRDG